MQRDGFTCCRCRASDKTLNVNHLVYSGEPWDAPNEALVNALSMMCPYGVREKQALLEAADLKARGDMLVAITEMELAKAAGGGDTPLQ